MSKNPTHRYKCIVKVGNDDFKSWNTSNLLKFVNFLDKKFADWRWFNVYDKKTRTQLGNFTKNNRPQSKFII